MMPSEQDSFATRFFRARPEIRQHALASEDYREYRRGFENKDHAGSNRTVIIDGRKFFVVGGDLLKDEDELMLDWARSNGLVNSAEVERFQAEDLRFMGEGKANDGPEPGKGV